MDAQTIAVGIGGAAVGAIIGALVRPIIGLVYEWLWQIITSARMAVNARYPPDKYRWFQSLYYIIIEVAARLWERWRN